MDRRLWTAGIVVSVVLFVGLAALSPLLPKHAMQLVMPIVMLCLLAGYAAFIALVQRGKKVILDVEQDRILLNEGRAGVFSLLGAALGLWRAGTGINLGTVLHLPGNGRPLRIGGREHRPPPALRLDAPPCEHVDVSLPAPAFEALLACVPFASTGPSHAAPPLRFPLLPNPTSVSGMLSSMAPWLGTMVLVGIVSAVLGSLGVFDTLDGQLIAMPFMIVIVVIGIVLNFMRSLRKSPVLEIEADPTELRLRDPKAGRLIAAAPWRAISTARGIWRITGRHGSSEFAVLSVRIPSYGDITVSIQDQRYRWNDAAPRVSAPRYVVGPPDWNALVDVLGMRSSAMVRQDYPV